MPNPASNKAMKVLIVEDHEGLAALLAEEIADSGLQARWTTTAEQALPMLHQWAPDLIASDLRLPGASGLDLLQHARTMPTPPAFLIITAFGTVSQAVEAIQAGADDFLTKPLDLRHFVHRMNQLLEVRRLRAELNDYRQTLSSDVFHGMYGTCPAMRKLFTMIEQVAKASGPVLILGESGTGKELVARALHACSERADHPFLAVNCAGVPEALMESEFFGHAAGAFTGAHSRRHGYFIEAEGGSLLLDEIAEMPAALQSKLLRILQDGRVRPVGENKEHTVNVRVLAATHQNPETAVAEGRLRQDLFFRLETFILRIPPLRERGDDIDLLAHRFLTLFNKRMGKHIQGFTETALEALRHHPFPGNVRELQNAIERAITFCNSSHIRREHLPARMRQATPISGNSPDVATLARLFAQDPPPSLSEIEQAYIRHILERAGGNKKRASDLLGITRKTLYHRLASMNATGPAGPAS